MSASNQAAWYLAQLIAGITPQNVNPKFVGEWAAAYGAYESSNGRGPQALQAWLAQPGHETIKQAVFAHRPNTPPPPAETGDYNLTDMGNAERLAEQHSGHLRFVREWDWMHWRSGRWEKNPAAAVRAAKLTVRRIYGETEHTEDDDRRKKVAGWAVKSEARTRLDAMLKLAESEAGVIAEPNQFDCDPYLLNCRNGVVDLRTGKLRPHNAADLITRMTGCDYDRKAECPTFLKFLHRIFDGSEALINFTQCACGYSLTGDTGEQVMLFCYGSGRNGKSTLLEIMRAVLGDYAQQSESSTFLLRPSDSIRNDIARMAGVRFVAAIEVGEGRRLNETLVKQVTGQDTITARFLHREYFEFVPQFKLWMAANHKPIIRGTDEAIWRRVLLVPFDVTIPPKEVDRNLLAKLNEERAGILAWMVRGCIKWQRDGWRPPEAVIAATKEYRAEMDVIAAFIDECCVINADARVVIGDLYRAYKKWAEVAGEQIDSQRSFSMRIAERDFERDRTHGIWVYRGLGLLAERKDSGAVGDPI